MFHITRQILNFLLRYRLLLIMKNFYSTKLLTKHHCFKISNSASTLIEISFCNIRLTICHMIEERKRGTYGGAICRRNEQKSSIYFVLAFLRLDVPIDRSSFFWFVKKKNLIGDFIRNNFVTWSRRKNRKFGRESNEIP